jgi:hypothetical protein
MYSGSAGPARAGASAAAAAGGGPGRCEVTRFICVKCTQTRQVSRHCLFLNRASVGWHIAASIAADGDQDLNFWARELEDVVREIMEDPVFKGSQHYKFETDLDEAGKRLFGGEANAGVASQIGQLRYILVLRHYILVHTCMYECVPLHTTMF